MGSFSYLAIFSSILASSFAQQTYTIDPRTVSNATRAFWCQSQITQCPLICLQTPANSAETRQNDCDPTLLTYACICSNGLSPNITEYSQTLPYFLCTEWGNQCASNCGQDSACASACRQDHPCGAQDPSPPNKTIIQASKSAHSAATAHVTTDAAGQTIYHGFGGGASASASASSTGGANSGLSHTPLIMGMGSAGSLTLLIGGLLLGFGLML